MAASSLTAPTSRSGASLRRSACRLDYTYNDANAKKRYDELWRFDKERYTREQATTDYAKLYPVDYSTSLSELAAPNAVITRTPAEFARGLDQMRLAEWVELYVSGGPPQQARAVDRERPFRRITRPT